MGSCTDRNEEADKLAKNGASSSFIGAEPYSGV